MQIAMQLRFNKKLITIAIVLLAGMAAGISVGAFFALTRDLPQIRSLENFRPQAVTRVYSSDNVLLAELYLEKRDPIPLKKIPSYLKSALVATEDRKFYTHSGIDLKGIMRALIKDIQAGEFVEGASTITQQLAKTLFLTPRKTMVRKIKEAILALQLERRYTKDEILELYLNQVYFGSGAYGVESAAAKFFNKSAENLSLSECALIAGMPKSPSRYSPLVNQDLALRRRNLVLKQMLDTGIISADAYDQAVNEELRLKTKSLKSMPAPYFVDYVKKTLEEELGAARLYKSGLTINTTLDYRLQQAAHQAVAEGLLDLGARMERAGIGNASPQAAMISLDVRTGGVLSMVGGRDFGQSPFNRAIQARRQPGSAFKPIVYAYAIEQGFAQNTLILDAPIIYKGAAEGEDWRPQNFSESYLGEITLREALAISQNIPAVRLIEMLGPDSVVRFAKNLGIKSSLQPNLSLALGTSEVTLLNLTAAYCVFPRSGKWIEPFGVLEVSDHRGRIVWSAKPRKTLAMSREGAAIITDMLKGVIEEGTGKKARILQGAVAGKTGTTNNYHDALFVGFSPSIAAGVWTGLDLGGTMGDKETGARAALPIWIKYMSTALEKRPNQYFDLPDSVIKVRMRPQTGTLATDESQYAVSALFKKGTEPN